MSKVQSLCTSQLRALPDSLVYICTDRPYDAYKPPPTDSLAMETQSPGAGPSRRAYVEDVDDEDCASISRESSSPYNRGPGATSRSLLLEVDASSSGSRSVRSVSVKVDLVPPPTLTIPDDWIPTLRSLVDAHSGKTGAPQLGPKPGVWCKCSLDLENGRNLVVCIDGTANQFGAKVRKLCYPLTVY